MATSAGRTVWLLALVGLFFLLPGGEAGGIDEAAWAQAEAKLRSRVPAGFAALRAEPFLVTGDIEVSALRGLTERTVRPCAEALYREFLRKRPDFIITIYLLKDDESYRSWSWKLFAREPTTRFGYYLSGERALLMNIATGSGTLVHEMVHPLMAVDFPNSPAWFNEGMGSLFEQCIIAEGPSIRGLVNWRLPILQQALDTPAYVPLEKVLKTTATEFYGFEGGAGYAEARYLLLYVQEQGLLKQLYAHFREHVGEDPMGRKSLETVLGRPLAEIEPGWLAWVRTLRWPEGTP